MRRHRCAIVGALERQVGTGDEIVLDLQVMDASAISLSRENRIPIIVFSIHDRGALAAVLKGKGRCTIITDQD